MANTNLADVLMLDAMPDDCLEYIFNKVELTTQIEISKVCPRFLDICACMWRRNETYQYFCIEQWHAFELTLEDLAYFVKHVRTAIREIRLFCYLLHDFLKVVQDDMGIESFPNARVFETSNVLDIYASDMDMLTLIEMLPNVQVFKLTQALTGRHLELCQNLQELHLYHDYDKVYELKNQYLPEIFENLTQLSLLDIRSFEMSFLDISAIYKCRQLHTLKLNLNALKPVLDTVLDLPKLKTLTVMLDNVIDVSRIDNVDSYDYKIYETKEFYYILENKSEKIIGIAVDSYYMPLETHWDDNLKIFECNKLRKFAFSNHEHNDNMLEKYVNMKDLRLLCCRHWSQLRNETLLKIVVACTKLEHLDVSYCSRINVDFLHGATHALRSQGKKKPLLTVYYAMTGIEDGIEKHPSYADWTTFMILSTNLPANSDKGLSYVQRGFEIDFE